MQERINKTIVFLIHFGIIMLIIGILTAFVQWFISQSIFSNIPLEVKAITEKQIQNLSLYIIFIGFMIPILLAFMTNFTKLHCAINNGRVKRLKFSFIFYIVGTINVILMILYRGLTFLIALSKDISLTFEEIEASLFFGNTFIRCVCTVLAYPIYVFGLIWYVLIIWNILYKFVKSKNS